MPNPSFELHSACPANLDELYKCSNWYSPTANTPDYFNSCGSNAVRVPQNVIGFQYARSGQGYVGIGSGGAYNDTSDNRREYVECKLTDTLKANKKYCVEFYVSFADSALWAIDRIGIYFSANQVLDMSTIDYLNFQPQVESPIGLPINDAINWVKISGSFVAVGNENYITIGNFHPATQITSDSIGGFWQETYYYIDDVSVTEIADCKAGNDASICFEDSLQLGTLPDSSVIYSWQPSDGLSNSFVANPKASPFSTTTYTLTQTQCNVVSTSTITVTVEHDCNSAPNIFIPTLFYGTGELKVSGLELNSALEIFDARGRKVFSSADYQNDFWTDELAAGVYFVRFIRPNQQVLNWKFCVIK